MTERISTTITIERELLNQLKIEAIKTNSTMSDTLTRILQSYFTMKEF